MSEVEKAKTRLLEISKKNENNKEYSLGDVLLLGKYEKILFDHGYVKYEYEQFSPSYYGTLYTQKSRRKSRATR